MITNIRQLIESQSKKYGNKTYLIFEEDGREVSYRLLHEFTSKTANLYKKLGVGKGDKVSLLLPNIPEFVFCYFGAMKIGAVAGPVNILLKAEEIAYIVNHSESKVLVTTPEFLGEVEKIRSQLPLLQHVIVIDDKTYPNTLPYYNELRLQPVRLSKVDIQPGDEAMIIYTSGTTGKPKGVLLTHHNLLRDAQYIANWFSFKEEMRMMCILPLFHVNGEVVTTITPLYFGGSVVLVKKFSVQKFWPAVAQYKVNVFSAVPTILTLLLTQPELAKGLDLSSLRFAICGAATLLTEVQKDFEKTFGCTIYEGYGLSETTCYSSFNPPDHQKRKIGSIGVAVGNEMKIFDDQDRETKPEEIGEIVIRGENVMKGYFKNPEATADAMRRGWFHSGDLGKRDSDGFFYILDRKKDMINRGGEKVFPREVDEVLYTHPKILDVATVGVPDKVYGEEVKAFVVLKPGQTAAAQDIIDFCRSRLADFKCPKSVQFVSSLPKGPTGKLLRRELRERG